MFKFYTRNEEQRFESKAQAIDFYERGSLECEGAEGCRYSDYAYELNECDNSDELRYMFSGEVKQVLVYNSSKDYLQMIQ